MRKGQKRGRGKKEGNQKEKVRTSREGKCEGGWKGEKKEGRRGGTGKIGLCTSGDCHFRKNRGFIVMK